MQTGDNLEYFKKNHVSSKIFKDYLKTIDKFQVINLQLEHIYGENDSKDKFIPSLIDKLHNKEKFIELTEGTQKRDFIYVKDVVDAYMILLSSKNLLNQYSLAIDPLSQWHAYLLFLALLLLGSFFSTSLWIQQQLVHWFL